MTELFLAGLGQDFLAFCVPPLLCAIFRLIFILWYNPYRSWAGKGPALYHCFRYGFWWGMDWNAYVFLISFLGVTVVGAFFPAWRELGPTLRLGGVLVYSLILFAAFWGKMIFYHHYHDIYNHILWLGKNAEKHNLLDVFFYEDHGLWVLLSFLPFGAAVGALLNWLLALPLLALPQPLTGAADIAGAAALFIAAGLFFYYCRYGGHFNHDTKPEWDEIPSVTKREIFLARATVDDLCALEIVYHRPLAAILTNTEAQNRAAIEKILPDGKTWADWERAAADGDPLTLWRRTAKGAKIAKPRHIFLIVEESYSQMPLDEYYAAFGIADGMRRFQADPHTASLSNFLPAGMTSRPSIVALMSGIFEARLELNEREDFWHGPLATSLPAQLKKLGYRAVYWYGGNPTYGSFHKFAPAVGFDEVRAATDFCDPAAPRSWVGVYDHIFFQDALKIMREKDAAPTFHFMYTTSNHGPYKMPLNELGFDTERVMPDAPAAVKRDGERQKVLGTYWYSDKALMDFVAAVRQEYPDSLIIVTGDHSFCPIEPGSALERLEISYREQYLTSFAMYQRELSQQALGGNTLAGHLNILPTIFELVAPPGFEYYSLFPPMTEPLDHAISPYHWLDKNDVGPADAPYSQPAAPSREPVDTVAEPSGQSRYHAETVGYEAITAWLAAHPELLKSLSGGKK